MHLKHISSFIIGSLFSSVITYFITKELQKAKNKKSKKTNNKQVLISKSIFVSGAFHKRNELQEKMIDLEILGYTVTSFWPDRGNTRPNTPSDYKDSSYDDIYELLCADTILVFMTDSEHTYGGTFTEIGFGLGTGHRIIVICDGKCEQQPDKNFTFSHKCMNNIFFWDNRIEHVSNYNDALKLLKGHSVLSPFEDFYEVRKNKYLSNINRGYFNHSGKLRIRPKKLY